MFRNPLVHILDFPTEKWGRPASDLEQKSWDSDLKNYVKNGFNTLTRTALKRVLKAYLPDSIFEQLKLSVLAVGEPMDLEMIGHNAVVHIEDVFEGSDELLEIYGSAEELVSNLKKFCSFTNSFEEIWEPYRNCIDYVFLRISDEYNPLRVTQRNVGEKPFLTKQEVFIHFRIFLLCYMLAEFIDGLPCLMLTLFLKFKQRKIESTFELVHVTDEWVATIRDQLIKMVHDCRTSDKRIDRKKKVKKLIGSNKDATIKAFEDLLAKFEVADKQTIGALTRYFDTEPPKNGTYPFEYMHWMIDFVFARLNLIIGRHPTLFSKEPVIKFVRIFEDGKRSFMMEDEFLKAAGREYRVEPIPPGYWKTLPSSVLSATLKEAGYKIELFRKRMVHAEHRAVPVHGPDGKLCKLAIDVFLEVLDDLILGLRVFDSKVENSKQRVMDFLNGLPDVMDMTEENMYFICEDEYNRINQKVQEAFADFKGAETEIEFAEIDLEADDYTSTAVDALKMLNIADEFTEEEIKKAALIASPDGDDSNEKTYSTTDSIRMMCKAIKIMLSEKNGTIRTFMNNHNGFHRLLGMDLDGLYAKKVAIKKEKELSIRMRPKYHIEADKKKGIPPFKNDAEYRIRIYQYYVEMGYFAWTKTTLKRVLKAFLPDSIFDKLKLTCLKVYKPMDLEMIGENVYFYIDEIVKQSGKLLAVYGSGGDLAYNLLVFSGFPGSFEEIWDPHRFCPNGRQGDEVKLNLARPLPYKNVKEELFVTKQDAFVYLRNRLLRLDEHFTDALPCLMITLFLKYKQRPIDSTFEFVAADGEEFKSIIEEVEKLQTKYIKIAKGKPRTGELLGGGNPAKASKNTMKAFENLLSKHGIAEEQTVGALQRYFKTEKPERNAMEYSYVLWAVDSIFTGLSPIIAGQPTIFSTQSAVKFVRVFIDGSSEFVMEEELVKAMGEEYRQGERHPGYWKTVTKEDMDRMLEGHKDKDQIELFETKIERTDHRAIPIRGPDGKLCKLAIDVFLEVLDDLIFGLRVFDSKVENSKQRVMDFLNGLSDVMDITEKNMYFICEKRYVEINQKVQEAFADFKKAETIIDFAQSTALDALKKMNIADEFTEEEIEMQVQAFSSNKPNGEKYVYKFQLISDTIITLLSGISETMVTFIENQKGFHSILGAEDGNQNISDKAVGEGTTGAKNEELDDKDSLTAAHSIPLSSTSKVEEKPEEEGPNREELPEDSSTATHPTPQNNPLEVVELSWPSDDKDIIPEQKKEVNNKRILTVDGPVLEGLSSEERELIKRAQDEWKSMKAALKDLDEQEIAEISQLERLKAELAEQESAMKELTAHRNAEIEKLKDEKKMLEEEKKELKLKLKMTPNTRDVFDEIQEGIKTDKIQERVNEMSVSVQKMRDAFSEEVEKYVERLKENRRRIEEKPEEDPPTDLLPDVPLPEVTLEFIRRWLEDIGYIG